MGGGWYLQSGSQDLFTSGQDSFLRQIKRQKKTEAAREPCAYVSYLRILSRDHSRTANDPEGPSDRARIQET